MPLQDKDLIREQMIESRPKETSQECETALTSQYWSVMWSVMGSRLWHDKGQGVSHGWVQSGSVVESVMGSVMESVFANGVLQIWNNKAKRKHTLSFFFIFSKRSIGVRSGEKSKSCFRSIFSNTEYLSARKGYYQDFLPAGNLWPNLNWPILSLQNCDYVGEQLNRSKSC